jgi:uncharacterized protein YfaA (DUF2138 family)
MHLAQALKWTQLVQSIGLVATLVVALAGCNRLDPQPFERYRLVAADGRLVRIDTQQGDVHLVGQDALTPIPQNGRLKLEVGRLYVLETGDLVAYEGNRKFGSPTEALLRKYGPAASNAP